MSTLLCNAPPPLLNGLLSFSPSPKGEPLAPSWPDFSANSSQADATGLALLLLLAAAARHRGDGRWRWSRTSDSPAAAPRPAAGASYPTAPRPSWCSWPPACTAARSSVASRPRRPCCWRPRRRQRRRPRRPRRGFRRTATRKLTLSRPALALPPMHDDHGPPSPNSKRTTTGPATSAAALLAEVDGARGARHHVAAVAAGYEEGRRGAPLAAMELPGLRKAALRTVQRLDRHLPARRPGRHRDVHLAVGELLLRRRRQRRRHAAAAAAAAAAVAAVAAAATSTGGGAVGGVELAEGEPPVVPRRGVVRAALLDGPARAAVARHHHRGHARHDRRLKVDDGAALAAGQARQQQAARRPPASRRPWRSDRQPFRIYLLPSPCVSLPLFLSLHFLSRSSA